MKATDLQLKTIPKRQDSASTWINWHKQLVSRLGTKQANYVWQYAYNSIQPSIDTSELRDYLKTVGLEFDATVTDKIVDTTSGLVGGITNFVGDFFKGGEYITIGIIVVILISIIMVIHGAMKHPEIIQDAAKAAIV